MPHAQGHIVVKRRPKNGNDGNPGLDGCILRVSEWAKNVHYTNDEAKRGGTRYIDIGVVTTGANSFQCYKCILEHDSSDSITYTNTKYWQKFNKLQPIYTPLIMAQNALLRFTQTNQLLVMKSDNSTVAAGMGGGDYPLWVGAVTPAGAPFRVGIDGSFKATKADIEGKITATSGTIGGLKISGVGLTNEGFDNDAYIILRNDSHNVFCGIGCNVMPSSSGLRAIARFENEEYSPSWYGGHNIAVLLSAKNGSHNHAFLGTGNGHLDGWMGGFKFSRFVCSSANIIYSSYVKIEENNFWIIYASVDNSGITLPRLSEVQEALGIGTSTNFSVQFTINADINSRNFKVYGRNNYEDSSRQHPWNTTQLPVMMHWNNDNWNDLTFGPGDTVTFQLVYDRYKSGTKGKEGFSLYYTARILRNQS